MNGSRGPVGPLSQPLPVPPEVAVDYTRRARVALATAALLTAASLARLITFIGVDEPARALAPLAAILVCAAVVLLTRRGRLWLAGNLLALMLFASGVSFSLYRGGLGAPVVVGMAVIPLLVVLIAEGRSGWVWLTAYVGFVVSLMVAKTRGAHLIDHLSDDASVVIEGGGALLVGLALFGIAVAYERAKDAALAQVTEAERRRAEAVEREYAERAGRLTALGQLAAGIIQEVNNPLAAISANLQYVLEELAPGETTIGPDVAEAVDDSFDCVERIRRILSELRIFTEPEDDVADLFDARAVIDLALRVTRSELERRGVALLVSYPDDLPDISAATVRLARVFVSLLTDAVSAIPHGQPEGARLELDVVVADPGHLVMSVRDRGIGMTTGDIAKALDPFYASRPPGERPGLGLSVSASLIDSLGGVLELESRGDRGATVRVTIPTGSNARIEDDTP